MVESNYEYYFNFLNFYYCYIFCNNVYDDKMLGCLKRQLCRLNQNENLIRILFYAHKTESSTQMAVHISHTEFRKKKLKELEKPDFVCVLLSRFVYFDYLRLAQFLYFKFIIRIENKVRWKVGVGRGREYNLMLKNLMLHHNLIKC